jgi:hypothetical protein
MKEIHLFRPFIKKIILYIIIVISFLSAKMDKTSLENYVKEGLQNNDGIKQREFLLEKSLYALKAARSLFFPSVSINTVYTKADAGRTIDFPIGTLLNPVYSTLNALTNSNRFPQLTDQHIMVNPDNYYDAKIHITLPIVNAEIYYNQKIKKELVTLQQATTAYKVAKQTLEIARYNKNFSEVRATTDGVVLRKLMNEGELVSPWYAGFIH